MMRTFAFSLKDLRFAGISPARLRQEGYSIRDFIAAELPVEDIMAAFCFSEIQAEGFDVSQQDPSQIAKALVFQLQ